MNDDEPKESVEITPEGEVVYYLTFSTEQFFERFGIFICNECEMPSPEDNTGLKKCEYCGTINHDRNIHLLSKSK